MSIVVMFGIAALAVFVLLVAVFLAALLAGRTGSETDPDPADDTIEADLHAHGVYLC